MLDTSIKFITHQIESKCEQLNQQFEELYELKKLIANSLEDLHQIEMSLSRRERQQNTKNIKRHSFDNVEFQEKYQEYILAKINSTELQNLRTQCQLKNTEIKLHKHHLEKKIQIQTHIQEELTAMNTTLQNELKKKADFIDKFAQLANQQRIKSITSTQSMANFSFPMSQDQFVKNQLQILACYYEETEVSLKIKPHEEQIDHIKDDDLSMCVKTQEYIDESHHEFIPEQSEKLVQRTLQEEFDECASGDEEVQLTSSLFL